MVIKFCNTLTRKKEPFKEIKKGSVKIYTCGPTVYHFSHIGNWRTFIVADILKRYLKFKGYEVVHVMNITDVGHLTSDADTGEDKMKKAAKKEKKTVWDIAEFYTKSFKDDLHKLNIEEPNIWCKATDHIKQQIDMIKILEKNGFTYFKGGNVYYDTSKLKDYGKLARLPKKTKARVDVDKNKKNPRDFVLWFTKSKFQEQDMKWDSPWGLGYPGWHIECSAMSTTYLGQVFDIHTGGIDLIFPHHENEIAQSEGAFKKKSVNYWLHGEHLLVDGEKMSKSKGNFYILKDVLDKGHSSKAMRYLLMSTHYRQKLNFTFKSLEGAEQSIRRFKEFMLKLKSVKGSKDNSTINKLIKKAKDDFENAMDDDLNISGGEAAIHTFMTAVNKLEMSRKDALKVFNLMMEFDKVLGILEFKKEKTPKTILELVKKRDKARKDKDWQLADKIRDEIKKKGYALDDTPKGSVVKKI